ncbi:MAG TPA: TIGR03618 family F420-dependent PPOX class oxidoreductase [Microthrixaceae bacterium]|jgi:PPOX class probable F420-dependent enzyme|nr:TIGR03618 family F420-dependent PPOX class oxidoreductase [Microthrixaceae bacterium]HQF93561.1 TIGR03618 family F420-dependent PPOX class oxidoreductase [Microthrixaceae bacterium]
MPLDPSDPSAEVLEFLSERHLATLSTHRPDGTIHVAPVGFTYDPDRRLARIITRSGSRKVANIDAHPGSRVVLCQVDGGRWLSLDGPAEVTAASDRVAEAVERYAHRYRQPGERDDRVAIEISVDRMMGRC